MRDTWFVLILVGLIVGLAVYGLRSALLNVGHAATAVSAETSVYSRSYIVIDENSGDKIEDQLNAVCRTNPSCEPILTIGGSDYQKPKVIVECRERR